MPQSGHDLHPRAIEAALGRITEATAALGPRDRIAVASVLITDAMAELMSDAAQRRDPNADVPPAGPRRVSYRIKELAALTGIAKQTIYDRCYAGELDCRKDGRSVLVMAESVKRWLGDLPSVSG